MVIKPHPELTEDYPAIDGIPKEQSPSSEEASRRLKYQDEVYIRHAERAIRSDIEEILKLDNLRFDVWYNNRKEVTEKLLREYETFASIPDLRNASEEQKVNLGYTSGVINNTIVDLRRGLDYLEKIKQVRAEFYED